MNKNKLFTIIAAISLLIVFVSLLFMMVLAPSVKEKTNPLYKKENQTPENAPVKVLTNFVLKTTLNTELNSRTLRGKFLFIYFGSTHCPNICLPHLLEMQNIIRMLQSKKNSIKFLFITTDPEKDTAVYLHNYFKTLDSNIIPLTGTKDQISKVLKNFRVYKTLFGDKTQTHSDVIETEQQTCSIVTPAPFHFIGKDGDLIKYYNHHISSDNITRDISHYIKVS
jgi:cytochrome oxidase Cu insertion factor (SCO1/SenC/PrrC family)